jgi:hypothetical protein
MKASKLTTSIPTLYGVNPVVAIHNGKRGGSLDFVVLRDCKGAVIEMDRSQAFHVARFIRSISGGRL